MRIVLINPNTNRSATGMMVHIAQEEAGPGAEVVGLTATDGVPLIADEVALEAAGGHVLALAPEVETQRPDAVIVAAFGDPGLDGLRHRLRVPVTGIAEAAMLAAGEGGRRFAVVTTTPLLVGAIARTAKRHGGAFLGTWTTRHTPQEIGDDAALLVAELREACRRALSEAPAEAIIIGGGPLARAARTLSGELAVAIVEPVPAALRLAIDRVRAPQAAVEKPV